jgi:hypothetical protein
LPFVWKKLSIEPWSINFDCHAAPADLGSFQDWMQISMSSPHDELLSRFQFSILNEN